MLVPPVAQALLLSCVSHLSIYFFFAACSRPIWWNQAVVKAGQRPNPTDLTKKDRPFLWQSSNNSFEQEHECLKLAPFASTLPLALHILRQERLMHALPTGTTSISKTIFFFPTACHVSFASELLSTLPGLSLVLELHSRKSQDARTKGSACFRDATEAILLSSDVAVRGMDFPGVTLVLQLNLPVSTEQYIYRLGCTTRAGTGGRGILVLDPAEQRFLVLKDVRPLGIAPVLGEHPFTPFDAHRLSPDTCDRSRPIAPPTPTL
ncbi:hypothetical protein D9615_005668 [Tricholomella constricta]|uniref:ATP-dependent RNA helicase n=1 Tax=Tricholomella constricta TaxID=117010 RepID=A0A8H5M3D0_9AGAR|nr:hypothetical protein D9615_005668 [Tricholomella constricta]